MTFFMRSMEKLNNSGKIVMEQSQDKQLFGRLKKYNIFEVDLNHLTEKYALPRIMTRYLEMAEIRD